MIGYLKPLVLKGEHRALYRSYHCGICHVLRREYGLLYSTFAGPDLVFFSIFLDAVVGHRPALARRSCVVAPLVTRQRVRVATDHARFTAAFGVYMAVEKLRDDYEDEGGLWRWLLLKIFSRGFRRARQRLQDMGFATDEVEQAMAEQAEIERQASLPLEVSMRPTVRIAGQLFAYAAKHLDQARARIVSRIGERVGRFLFFMDNLLDLGPDLRGRRYNALAAAYGLTDASEPAAAQASTDALEGARAQVRELASLVPSLPAKQEYLAVLTSVLVDGLRDKLRRFEGLDAAARASATLRSITPTVSLRPRLKTLFALAYKPLRFVWLRTQAVAILALLLVAPRWVWAATTAARLLASTTPGAGDSDAPAGGDPPPGEEQSIYNDWVCCDTCDVNDACTNACEDACSKACEAVCGDPCEEACDDACTINCCGDGGENGG